MPCQHGTFDAGRHVADVFEGEGFVEFFELVVVRDLALDHRDEFSCELAGFFDALAADQVDHHVGRGLADGAADAFERGVFDNAVLDFELERDFVAAARVVALERAVRARERVAVFGAPAVLADELRIDIFKTHIQAPS